MSGAIVNDWNWIDFDVVGTRALLEHARGCDRHRPTPDQMLENRYRRDDASKPPKGVLPPMEDVALEVIPPGLHVVVGEGLYLESNGISEPESGRLFAPGCDPVVDADWRSEVECLAGAEEQVLFPPADAVEEVLQEAGDRVWLALRRDEERFGVEEYGLAPEPDTGTR